MNPKNSSRLPGKSQVVASEQRPAEYIVPILSSTRRGDEPYRALSFTAGCARCLKDTAQVRLLSASMHPYMMTDEAATDTMEGGWR